MKDDRQLRTLRRVLSYLRADWALLLLCLFLAAASVAGTLYIPILVGDAIDCIVAAGTVDFAAVAQLTLRAALLALAVAAAQWLLSALSNHLTFRVVRDVRREAFAHIQVLPLSFLDAHPGGELVSRVIADVDQFADGLLMGFTQLFTGVLTIVGTLGFMLRIDWRIALVVVVLTPLSLFAAKFIAGRTHSMFSLQSATRGEQTAHLDEMIAGQKVVQAFGYAEKSLARFDEINARLQKAALRATFFSSLTNPVTRFVNSMVYAAVALSGALAAVGGAISVGALTTFLSYANQYTKPFNEISGVVTELQNALACAQRIFALMDEPAQQPDAPEPKTLHTVSGDVQMRDVSFSYVPERPLIEHLNLRVRAGDHVAIVGPTGCGKTTLINLLMRFYDVHDGEIAVDGENIQSLTRKSLRGAFGMVLQDTWLKDGTIRENICMGKPDASDAEMIAAAKAAHADSFIRRLPQGYDTVIHEDGESLSQGQRQLLCITRVMLCLPPMLILDEATSSIDTRTELKIQSAFSRMMQGRTSFIVAHRLSTIREADVILVMRNGHIVEQGTHDELLANGCFYAQLYNSQFSE